MEKFFIQILTFERNAEGDIKTALFTDKFNNKAVVTTKDRAVIPGIRYSCKLYSESHKTSDQLIYDLINFRVVEDDIQILHDKRKNIVFFLLDNKPVEALNYNPKINSDYDSLLAELQVYFRYKTFQLSTMQDIQKFTLYFKETLEKCYQAYKKQIIKSFKK
jgi:hypothetical protein